MCTAMQKVIIFIAPLAIISGAMGFNFTNIFKRANPSFTALAGGRRASGTTTSGLLLANEETQLLHAIVDTKNGRDADAKTQALVLSIVRLLETGAAPSPMLLSDIKEARSLLDWDWFLRYTMPSKIKYDGTIIAPDDNDGGNDDRWVAIKALEGESKINMQ